MPDIDHLFREFHAPIVRYLTRQLDDADLAEELAQETFVRAFRYQQDAKKPVVNQRAWLFTVATNLVRDSIRRDVRRRRHLEALRDEIEREDAGPEQAEAEERSEDALRQAALAKQALDGISERDRSALFMSQEGLDYPEIAAALGLSVQSVGTTLTRARRKVVQGYEHLARQNMSGGAHVAS